MRKSVFGVSDRAVQPQKMARGLNFRILEVDGLYYPYSENKGADQLRSCVFVFAYAKNTQRFFTSCIQHQNKKRVKKQP